MQRNYGGLVSGADAADADADPLALADDFVFVVESMGGSGGGSGGASGGTPTGGAPGGLAAPLLGPSGAEGVDERDAWSLQRLLQVGGAARQAPSSPARAVQTHHPIGAPSEGPGALMPSRIQRRPRPSPSAAPHPHPPHPLRHPCLP